MDLREKMKKVTDEGIKAFKVANEYVSKKIQEYEEREGLGRTEESEMDFEEVVRRCEEEELFDSNYSQETDKEKFDEEMLFDIFGETVNLEGIKKELIKYGKTISDLEIFKKLKDYGRNLGESEIVQTIQSETSKFADVLRGNVYRFHCLSFVNKHYDLLNKTKSEQVYEPFLLPKGMKKQDAFRVLSYLGQYIEKNSNSSDGISMKVATLDSVLERYGFLRFDFPTAFVVDLFAVDDSMKFRKSEYYSKYFEWYIPNVSRDEVVEIYKNIGMIFEDIDFGIKSAVSTAKTVSDIKEDREWIKDESPKIPVKVRTKSKDK